MARSGVNAMQVQARLCRFIDQSRVTVALASLLLVAGCGSGGLTVDLSRAFSAAPTYAVCEHAGGLDMTGMAFFSLRHLSAAQTPSGLRGTVREWRWDASLYGTARAKSPKTVPEAIAAVEGGLEKQLFCYTEGVAVGLTWDAAPRCLNEPQEESLRRSSSLADILDTLGLGLMIRGYYFANAPDAIISPADDARFKGEGPERACVAWVECADRFVPRCIIVDGPYHDESPEPFAAHRYVLITKEHLFRVAPIRPLLSSGFPLPDRDTWYQATVPVTTSPTLGTLIHRFEVSTGKRILKLPPRLAGALSKRVHISGGQSDRALSVVEMGFALADCARTLDKPRADRAWALYETADSWQLEELHLPRGR